MGNPSSKNEQKKLDQPKSTKVNKNKIVDHNIMNATKIKRRSEIVIVDDKNNDIGIICKCNDFHIHFSENECNLLVFGYFRETQNEFGINIIDDMKNECWKYFKLITKINKKEFEVGIFYQGYECQIDLLGLKSLSYSDTIYMKFIYDNTNKQKLLKEKNNKNKNNNDNDSDDDDDDDSMIILRYFWLNYDGKMVEYSKNHVSGNKKITHLKSQQSFEQHTFVTHPWKLFNKQYFLGLYLPTSNYPKHLITFTNDIRNVDALCVSCDKI